VSSPEIGIAGLWRTVGQGEGTGRCVSVSRSRCEGLRLPRLVETAAHAEERSSGGGATTTRARGHAEARERAGRAPVDSSPRGEAHGGGLVGGDTVAVEIDGGGSEFGGGGYGGAARVRGLGGGSSSTGVPKGHGA